MSHRDAPSSRQASADDSVQSLLSDLKRLASLGELSKHEINDELRLVFRHFAHKEERGWRMSLDDLEICLQALEDELVSAEFARSLYQAWAPEQESISEGRFVAGFKVYLAQRESWLQQWWLAKSGGVSEKAPAAALVEEVRKVQPYVAFEQFQAFCDRLAEDQGSVPPPTSFLRAVWEASADSLKAGVEPPASASGGQASGHRLADAEYDALIAAYADSWREWLGDWIDLRRVVIPVPVVTEATEDEKAALNVQRHWRAYKARRAVDVKRSESLLYDLGTTLAVADRANALFQRFDSGKKGYWTAYDVSHLCTELWHLDGELPPPMAFAFDAAASLRDSANPSQKEKAPRVADVEEEVRLSREEVLSRLWSWSLKRRAQFDRWAKERYTAIYACPNCTHHFRVTRVPPKRGRGASIEYAKVVEDTYIPGVATFTAHQAPPRMAALAGYGGAGSGSAGRALPHPAQVAHLHDDIARNVAAGAGACVLPAGAARPALAGRLLLQAAVAGSSRGAPVLLLAQESEMSSVSIWMQAASPDNPIVALDPYRPDQWRSATGKVSSRQLPALLMTTPQNFKKLWADGVARITDVDFVLLSCPAREAPLLQEVIQDAPFTLSSKRPRVVALLDSADDVHQALVEHLSLIDEAKGHVSTAVESLDAAKGGQADSSSEAALRRFARKVQRYPGAAVSAGGAGAEEIDFDKLPLGFAGPLGTLKRQAAIPTFQDGLSSSEEEAEGAAPQETSKPASSEADKTASSGADQTGFFGGLSSLVGLASPDVGTAGQSPGAPVRNIAPVRQSTAKTSAPSVAKATPATAVPPVAKAKPATAVPAVAKAKPASTGAFL